MGGFSPSFSSVPGSMTVGGDLDVKGTTTTIETTNLVVTDPLIVLAKDVTGTPANDAGLIVERGSSTNVGMLWDESADSFAFVNTTEAGSTAGNVTLASYATVTAGNILPGANGTHDLGSASARWNNVYTNDLHLANERGDWTVIEEENYLSLRNNKNGKLYKIVMEEISED